MKTSENKSTDNLDDFKCPSRKPWLLGIILVALALGIVQYWRVRNRPEPVRPVMKEEPVETLTGAPKVPVKREVAPKETPPGVDPIFKTMKEIRGLEAGGALVESRKRYLDVLKQSSNRMVRAEAEAAIGRINVGLLVSAVQTSDKTNYVVRQNDSLDKIARKFGTTDELVQKSNGLSRPNLIKAGDQLMVFTGKFSIVVSKTRNDLTLNLNNEMFKKYTVGTGKQGKTPVGTFKVTDKIKEPPWWKNNRKIEYGDPENILGTRWMAITATEGTPDVKGYGIHGTWASNTIGKAESAGCIRMLNSEVEELFSIVPVGTTVRIVE